jgi:hypothetical protein
MRSHRILLSAVALSALISATALAQGAPPPAAPPPADQPAQAAPPPGYPPAQQVDPQQQPGYPQQGYPQQGYPQQQGYPPPPQGYLAPAAAAPPPPAPVGRHGFLPIIYIGANSFQGKTGDGLGVGFRLGTILGGRLNEQFSINGELTIDVLNPSNVPSGEDLTVVEVDLALSPLFHAPVGMNGEFVVGPKLGFMGGSSQDMVGGVSQGEGSATGYVYGINAGMFFNVSQTTALGGLLSFQGRSYSKVCFTPPGGSQSCSSTGLPDADKVLGISGAVTF